MCSVKIFNTLNVNTPLETLEELHTVLANSYPTISIWGTRQITYNEECISFNISLNQLAEKVAFISYRCFANGMNDLQRAQWILISREISNFYKKTDKAAENTNFISRLFLIVREFNPAGYFFATFGLRFSYEEDKIVDNFRAYSEEELENFKKNMNISGCFFTKGSCSISPQTYVHEAAIRYKASIDRKALKKIA
jgi:hypothetical protein